MKRLFHEATNITPLVEFDPQSGMFRIEGKSMPEDVASFFLPLIEWLEAYGESPSTTTEVELKLTYFNTASSKYLLDFLFKLQHIHEEHGGVAARWYYQEEDESMEDAGEAYQSIVHIPFEMIVVDSDE